MELQDDEPLEAEDLDALDLDDDAELDGGIIPDDYDELDDDYDDYEDASPEEIDFAVAMYREDGAPIVAELGPMYANDLDELIAQLRRLPGDAGALGAVSIAGEFFVLCRVRGRTVQVLLSDGGAANDWPIARDVVDYLGIEVPDPDDDIEPVGDIGLLADQGISEFDMDNILDDIDEDSDRLVRQIAKMLRFESQFDKVVGR